jgi:hypothetical protein
MITSLQFDRIRRVSQQGEIWDIVFQPGLNVIVGPQNSSKTISLRIIDFCLGDRKRPREKFSTSIVEEYDRFEVDFNLDGVDHQLVRQLHQRGQLSVTETDGQNQSPDSFNAWILDLLRWPQILIPRGLDVYSITEEVPLTFRTIYRHIYRRADSWTEFASQEYEHHRRAVFCFLLGISNEVYPHQGRQVAITRT